ncbi:MAG: tRNA (guanine(10)-N(2))-dimethyltransferase [ANME-2 cluster archaeon]|nr:MAG: tRNA (guanine(10)-N(2))-dimethyltransferase [ANME-2 cluster archaeon]
MKTKIICEGDVQIKIPLPDDLSNFPPSSAAVFYNPEMELNRDITVASISGFINQKEADLERLSYVDVMAATGIRGVRIAFEVGLRCHLNDWNEDAYQLINDNIKLNGLEDQCTTSHQNANTLLHQESFDVVDIDPFGSPAPFLDSAARSARGLLCVTATDTAPLCGAHLKSGIRKYAALPLNTEYHREMGARVLLGAITRALARRDKGMNVLLTHATRHYVRVYVDIVRGVPAADRAMRDMGFLAHCFECGFRSWKHGQTPLLGSQCPHCGKSLKVGGPLWLGHIQEPDFCQKVLDELENRKPAMLKQACKIVSFCRDEINVPTYYDQHWLSKKLKISPGPIDDLIKTLKAEGFHASRTHFSGTGFKTDAEISQINEIMVS